MDVLFFTTLVSLLFAAFFLLAFLQVRRDGKDTSAEQESLIPFRFDDPQQPKPENEEVI